MNIVRKGGLSGTLKKKEPVLAGSLELRIAGSMKKI